MIVMPETAKPLSGIQDSFNGDWIPDSAYNALQG